MPYSPAVLDHFDRPRHAAGPPGEATRVGRAGSEDAGAIIEFHLETRGTRVGKLGFRAWGCPHTIAVASWLCATLQGGEVAKLGRVDLDEVAAALGLPAEKWHCVLIAEDALRAALAEE